MIRWLGAALVWGGCGLWGLQRAREARQRVRLLEDMVQAVEVLEREVSLNQTALPELLHRLSQEKSGQAGGVFAACVRQLAEGNGFSAAWEYALERGGLQREDIALLRPLARVLGRYDAAGQVQMLMRIRREVERACAQRREETQALVRVYRILGVTAGGFLALTLL